MSSEIQFGDLEHSKPKLGTRPDRDAHFAVLPVGPIGLPDSKNSPVGDLMIFVDLDVMRDMEAHAVGDTRVELGGVMLGKQHVDDEGKPFVVISDCLRAEHYQATKGSFTFTHDTWSQITRQRKLHRPDLEMVGWYHTHPGWTVFLSGMDLFICDHFFNRPLDVALVIDPVNDGRGWFQWTDDARPATRPTKGFYLMTNRYRQQELKYFSRLYSNGPDMNVDPRYSDSAFGGTSPVVNIHDNRRPVADLVIVAMLLLQFMLMGFLAWRMLAPPVVAEVEEKANSVSLDEARDQAYRDILRSAVSSNGQDPALVENYTALKTDNARLLGNLDGQLARSEKLVAERDFAQSNLATATMGAKKLKAKFEQTRIENEELLGELKKYTQENGAAAEQSWLEVWSLWWWSVVVSVLAVGGIAGFVFGLRYGLQKGRFDAFTELGEYDHPDKNQFSSQATVRSNSDSENVTLSLDEEQRE